MIKTKRGISPVIATVILVAMVVIIGIILFLWFKGMSKEAVIKFDKNIALVCQDVEFNADYMGGTLDISNKGNIPIFDFKIKISKKGSHETIDLRKNYETSWPETGLNQGDAVSINLDLDPDVTQITLIPVLVGESDSVKKTHVCDEKQNGFSIDI